MLCRHCGKANPSDANFCEYCGKKLAEVCIQCWVKNGQPHSCPREVCPGRIA